MKQESKLTLELCGKTFTCEVIDGVRYIEGKTVADFVDWLVENEKWDIIKLFTYLGRDILRLNE